MRLGRVGLSLCGLAALLVPTGVARAQKYWHDDQGRDVFRVEWAKPFLKGSGEKFLTGASVASLSYRLDEGFRIEADLPTMRAAFDFGGTAGEASQFRMGNPYIGLRIGNDEKHFSGTVGLRLPLSGKPEDAIGAKAIQAGALTDYDDFEAFAADLATVRTGLEYRTVTQGHVLLDLRGGTSLQVATDGSAQAQSVVLFDYGSRIGWEGSTAQLAFGFTGRYWLNVPTSTPFSQRAHHQFSGSFEYRPGRLRPRVTVRLPLEKSLRDQSSASVAVGLSLSR